MPLGPDAGLDAVASLAQPQRQALYRYVVARAEPVSREQAAEGLGVARHVAKFHLDRLVDDGLLEVDYRRPSGRGGPGAGRPTKMYRRSSRQLDVTVPARRYEVVGRLLAEAVSRAGAGGVSIDTAARRAAHDAGRSLGAQARKAGRDQGRSPPARRGLTAAVGGVLADLGYEPKADRRGLSLANCPFHSLARDYTGLVCGMNLALIDGVLSGLETDRLHAVLDPAPERCCVRVLSGSRLDPG